MTDLAGSLWANWVLTSHLRNHHGNLAGTGAGTGNEIQKLSRLRHVLPYLRRGFESMSNCPSGFRRWAGKREVYQVLRLFFTGSNRGAAGASLVHSRRVQQRNRPFRVQSRTLEIFLVSSFNLYASFALLVVVRSTQSMAPFTTTRLPALVAGSPNLNCAHRIASF
jgi:hypothetical protein